MEWVDGTTLRDVIAAGRLPTRRLLKTAQQISVTGFTWVPGELWLIAVALVVGIIASLLPAWRAYRTDIAHTLARG